MPYKDPEKQRASAKRRYEMNREQRLEQCRRYREAHGAELRSYRQKNYQENKEAILAKHKEYRAANSEKLREYAKRWRAANAEHVTSEKRKWYEANRDRILQGMKEEYATNKEELSRARWQLKEDRLGRPKPLMCEIPGCLNTNVVLDHDHRTGKARGFICNACNCAIGLLTDCPVRAAGIAKYLSGGRKHRG